MIITIDDRAVLDALMQLRSRMSDLSPVLHDIGQALMEGSRRNIEQGHDWLGQAFAPNKASTLAKKRGSKPLINEGMLVGPQLFYDATPNSVTVGSTAFQAGTMQFGAQRGAFGQDRHHHPVPWGDIPSRRFLPVTADEQIDAPAVQLILTTIADYLG